MPRRNNTVSQSEIKPTMSSDNENEVQAPDVSEPVTTVDTITDLVDRIETIKKNNNDEYKSIVSELKAMRKIVARLEKKKAKRKVDPNKPRAPSGITRPTRISDELSDFLGRERGELIPRTQVTSLLSKYIKDNELKSKENGKFLDLDKDGGKFRDLLKLGDTQVTYFSYQTYLTQHFPDSVAKKKAREETTTPATETETETKTKDTSTKARTTRRVRKTRKEISGTA
jgi:chromatin remodeling complex protein RSC6